MKSASHKYLGTKAVKFNPFCESEIPFPLGPLPLSDVLYPVYGGALGKGVRVVLNHLHLVDVAVVRGEASVFPSSGRGALPSHGSQLTAHNSISRILIVSFINYVMITVWCAFVPVICDHTVFGSAGPLNVISVRQTIDRTEMVDRSVGRSRTERPQCGGGVDGDGENVNLGLCQFRESERVRCVVPTITSRASLL